MIVLRESFLQWANWLLPAMPLLVSRRKPGVRWFAHNGAEIALRIVRDTDAERIQSFVRGLSMKTRYHRFFYPLHELTPDLLERSLHADPSREVTLLATTEEDGEEIVIGMAQYFVTGDDRAEFAIVVADKWQRQGIGKSTLYALSWLARAVGIVWFDGDVLMENGAMRGLLSKAGYNFRSSPEGGNVMRATRRLNRPPEKCSKLEAFLAQVGARPANANEIAG
jgi:GNAT superfamily N-acetyltransferase